MSDDDAGLKRKVGLTMLIIILAIPGLVIEPGPVSEVVALSMVAAVWGVDVE